MKNAEIKKILYIEDNVADIRLFEEAISHQQLAIDLDYVTDGQEMLDFFEEKKKGHYKDLPELIVTDLNLPKVTGQDVIKVIKQDPVFRKIPIVVFTTSNLLNDIDKCYEYGANAYMYKPLDIDHVFEVVELIDKYWLRTCLLVNNPMLTSQL